MADIRITIDISESLSTALYPGDAELVAHIGNWLRKAGLWPARCTVDSLPIKSFMSPLDWNRLRDKNKQLHTRLDNLQAEHAALHDENADLKLQNANLKQSWNLLHGQMADLKAANSKLLENNATFVREDDEINTLRQRVQFLTQKVDDLQVALANRTEEANELVRRNTQLRTAELASGIRVHRKLNGGIQKITIEPDRLDQP